MVTPGQGTTQARSEEAAPCGTEGGEMALRNPGDPPGQRGVSCDPLLLKPCVLSAEEGVRLRGTAYGDTRPFAEGKATAGGPEVFTGGTSRAEPPRPPLLGQRTRHSSDVGRQHFTVGAGSPAAHRGDHCHRTPLRSRTRRPSGTEVSFSTAGCPRTWLYAWRSGER